MEAHVGVGKQVPDDDQDRSADGDGGLLLAAAADEPLVAGAEEVRVSAPTAACCEGAGEVAVPVAVAPLPLVLPAEDLTPGANPAHEHKWAG